jgi:integrase
MDADTRENGQKNKEGIWLKTPTPCLVKYGPAGTYYLRARIGGQPYREALGTKVYDAARCKLAGRLNELRFARGGCAEAPRNLHEALGIVRAKILSDPSLKSATVESYKEALDRMIPGGPAAVPPTPLSRLTPSNLAPWWKAVCAKYGPQRANHLLMLVRRALKFARAAGSLVAEPTEELKRMKIKRTRLNLITLEEFGKVIARIRSRPFAAHRDTSADWVEWQTYTGLRPGEMRALLWSHLDEARGVLMVHGGAEGTKNRESRPVPIIAELARLVADMRGRGGGEGLIFPQTPPREALTSACKALGFPHLRIYDLRHLFATTCNAAGVDVPTFAKWLGHSDGGALAMRTYVHPHDEHSRESAAKVKFS